TLEYEVATNFFKGKNKIQSGKYYSIHVNHPKYGAAYAQDIYIPQPFTIKAANLIKTGINNTKICGTNEYEDLMASFSISFGEFQEDSTYFNYIEFANMCFNEFQF
ncbi:MAG TPA: hypothetical protein PKD85_22925, partial [Saprospiraceae bacterium]|nr:hypothetical protein [Saprospiraceae bacterium]